MIRLPYVRLAAAVGSKALHGNGPLDVFDRQAKRRQKNRASLAHNASTYDYIKDEVACRLVERMRDVSRAFEFGLDLGCGRGHVAKHVDQYDLQQLIQCDLAEESVVASHVSQCVSTMRLHVDEEFLPFKNNMFDVVVSSLSLHWVNDLPSCLRQICDVLKEDGCFIGSMFATDTLFELRSSILLAEQEREGGIGQHVSPLTSMQDMGGLLTQCGFTLTTIDIDDIIVNYPNMFELMNDLKGMGESNAAWRRRSYLHRETLLAAAAIYQQMYGNEDGTIPGTFRILFVIGWKPSQTQAQPIARGSATVSLRELTDTMNDTGQTPY